MKRYLIALIIIVSCHSVVSAYCPTTQEYQAKMEAFSARFDALKPNLFFNYEAAEKLNLERQAFMDSVPVACVKYLKSTNTPACEKVSTLSVGYAMMSKNKRITITPQVRSVITPELNNRCQFEVDNLRDILAVFD